MHTEVITCLPSGQRERISSIHLSCQNVGAGQCTSTVQAQAASARGRGPVVRDTASRPTVRTCPARRGKTRGITSVMVGSTSRRRAWIHSICRARGQHRKRQAVFIHSSSTAYVPADHSRPCALPKDALCRALLASGKVLRETAIIGRGSACTAVNSMASWLWRRRAGSKQMAKINVPVAVGADPFLSGLCASALHRVARPRWPGRFHSRRSSRQ